MAKTVYVMRHGDAYGNLTDFGVEQVEASGRRLRQELGDLEEITIHHSPLERARESAEVLARTLEGIDVTLKSDDLLTCGGRSQVHVVAGAINEDVSIIVAHQPNLETYLEQNGIFRGLSTAEYVKVNVR